MDARPLPSGRIAPTPLALGTAALAGLYRPVDAERAAATVDAAWEVGIRAFDTAPHYGLGVAERRLGAALRHRPREEYTLSTKVGRLLRPLPPPHDDDLANGFAVPADHERVWDFGAAGIRRSLEESLERLGLDRVDIALVHDPDDHVRQALDEAMPELHRLRDEGVVAAIGVGMNSTRPLTRFVREADPDLVLCAGRWTLLDHSALADLLPAALDHGVGVLVGGVFNSGLLADPRPGATFDYAEASPRLVERALRLREVCERHGVPLRAAALRFPFGHPAVVGVLTGGRSPAEVTEAAEALATPLPSELWTELRAEGLLPEGVPVPGEPPVIPDRAGEGR
ncbi:aldo/keto reductase [Streptomyces alkaliphilus]|uniref:aldo/keto reductase n=1 Tax=Streptomyces alkaliphilus TaxID=1472722 RepID=UPI0011812438|nr:aldo/keto reductase [Streptomyces alkaliphilus]MQS08310.1 aldo/keto reductase [Streptomyces alkaliphilus]